MKNSKLDDIMMNRTVAKIILILYAIIFVVVFWGFQCTNGNYPGGTDGLYKFGVFLSPLPSILMSIMYSIFVTNFIFLLVNTVMAINTQIVTFIVMFFVYAFLSLISHI